jgi:4-hydroxy-tetrahydrodipicolinate synthase
MAQIREIAGVLPVIQTPFLADESIDEATLINELNWVLDQGVAGLTTGMVSEILRMTESERHHLSEIVVGVAKDRGALSIISCGSESTKTAIAHAQHAQEIGADAVMAIGPLTVVLGDKALFAYYDEIAKATNLNIVIQDASGYVGRPLSLELQIELLEKYGARIYFKPEAAPIGQNVTQMRDMTGGRARILEGTGGGALVDSFRRGIVGTMPGAEVCWAIQKMWDALCAGDYLTATDISDPLLQLVHLSTGIDIYVAIEKYLLKKQGVFTSTKARPPLSFLMDPETEHEVDIIFDRLKAQVGNYGSGAPNSRDKRFAWSRTKLPN